MKPSTLPIKRPLIREAIINVALIPACFHKKTTLGWCQERFF
jgi:hypothetical protein